MKTIKIIEYILLAFFLVCVFGFFYGEFAEQPLFPSVVDKMDILWPSALLAYSGIKIYQGNVEKKKHKD